MSRTVIAFCRAGRRGVLTHHLIVVAVAVLERTPFGLGRLAQGILCRFCAVQLINVTSQFILQSGSHMAEGLFMEVIYLRLFRQLKTPLRGRCGPSLEGHLCFPQRRLRTGG
ncbi:MAG: hypothetical protein GY800_12685 [Planctomycetes bacterium]|nr:hypothetical protein [Planctomycetota bacterium]